MNCWLCIVCSIVLLASVLSSPIRTPRTPNPRVYPNFLFRDFALVSDVHGPALGSTMPRRASIDAADSDFDEEDEDESFWSFVHLVEPIFLPPDSPSKHLSIPGPGDPPPRTAASPLRC
jgi:hypothetical protein